MVILCQAECVNNNSTCHKYGHKTQKIYCCYYYYSMAYKTVGWNAIIARMDIGHNIESSGPFY